MSNRARNAEVTGTTVWHINADEPTLIDYDTSYKKDAQDALYEAIAFRSSDHDPVIVGLDLVVTHCSEDESIGALTALLPTGTATTTSASARRSATSRTA